MDYNDYNQSSSNQPVMGKLKIFFGYAAGVGKTYAMLEAAQELKKENVDVVVGYIEKIRSWSMVPIIIVSARSEDQDKVETLDAGADDYLTKPFSVDEFLARIRVALRRMALETTDNQMSSSYENGKLRIDYASGCAYLGDEEIHLTPIEFKLLTVFAKNTGKVLTHNYLLKEVWGSSLASDIPSLRVFMTTLRKKIEPDPTAPKYIQTILALATE